MKRSRGFSSIIIAVLLLIIGIAGSKKIKEQAQDALKKCRLTLGRTCPDPLYVKFHLYTRQNRAESQLVQVTGTRDNLSKTNFDPSNPNKLIIHGTNPRLYKSALVSIKDAYLEKEDANVWMIDWSRLAAGDACVMFSMRNTVHVARCVAQLVAAIKLYGPQSSLHVVADRAGVRVAHSLALAIKPLQINRITGLNPEGGTAPTGNDPLRLSLYDAEFVDTIHSSPFLPKTEMFGQVDFYVNPNKFHQPGCNKKKTGRFTCDQRRAIEYFAESINSQVGFIAWECKSYTNFAIGTCNPHPLTQTMGNSCSSQASGIYITYTADETPYALGPWDGKLYQDKGPKKRTDKLSLYSTAIKEKIELIDENTPEIVKELDIVDNFRARLGEKTGDLKKTAMNIGLVGAKAIAAKIMKNKQFTPVNENPPQDVAD